MERPAADKNETSFLPYALWITLSLGLGGVFVSLLPGLRAINAKDAAAIVVSIMLAALVSRHDLKIPKTHFRISPKDIVALWSVVWLGITAGVLVAAAGSVATCFARRFDRQRGFLLIASDAISIFIVGSAYLLTMGAPLSDVSARANSWKIFAAVIAMSAAHYIINSTLNYLGQFVTGESDPRTLFSDSYIYSAVSYLVTAAGTLLVNFIFFQFGLELGLVLLPITIAASVAHTIHINRLATKTREITEASRIHQATIEALATAIDARDQLGVGHVRRTQIFAIGIGEYLGLSEQEMCALRTGALLHDIGKLAVPDHILNKPETLTPAEAEKVKIHASVGASILEKVRFDSPVVPTVKYHHENWDGSGYPEALRGEKIPLTARILSVADAYDTIRGSRPYREASTKDEACRSLRHGSGTRFDPRLVKIFLDNVERLEAEITRKGLGYHSGDDRLRRLDASGEDQNYVEQIKLANREAFTMYELAKDFSALLTLDETLKLLTDKIREFVSFDNCTVFLLDKQSGDARAAFVAGKHAAVFNDHIIKAGSGVTGRLLHTKKPEANCDPWPDLQLLRSSLNTDFRSMIALPILTEGELIGAVSLYSIDPTGYSDEHLRLVETITQIAADAVAKSQRHAETESHALTDPMTGLPNARSLQLQFEKELARAQRNESTFQVLMLDLDGFKQVNDTLGHKVGDKMLFEIGRVIKRQLREYDFLARYAGDEFVALVPDVTVEGIYDLCRRIEKEVEAFELIAGDDIAQVGVSIGWATYPSSGHAFDQLLIAADKEMYSTKSRRKKLGARSQVRMIPKPNVPLEFDMPLRVDLDEIDTIVEIDEDHIYVSPLA